MEKRKLEKFPEGVLEYVSKIISGYKTGSELTEFFSVAGYPDIIHDGSTKWEFVYGSLKDLNSKADGQYHVAKFIQAFCDPTQWIGRDDVRKQVMSNLNEALIYVNLQLNQGGKLFVTERKINYAVEEENRKVPTQAKALSVFPIFRTRDIKQEEDLCFVLCHSSPHLIDSIKNK